MLKRAGSLVVVVVLAAVAALAAPGSSLADVPVGYAGAGGLLENADLTGQVLDGIDGSWTDPPPSFSEWGAAEYGRGLPTLAEKGSALEGLGTIALGATAFGVGWEIGRTIDTKWLHLSGDDLGTEPSGVITGASWVYRDSIPNITGWSGPGWQLQYADADDGSGLQTWATSASNVPCNANDAAFQSYATGTMTLGTVYEATSTDGNLCQGSHFRKFKTWLATTAEIEDAVVPDDFQDYTAQTHALGVHTLAVPDRAHGHDCGGVDCAQAIVNLYNGLSSALRAWIDSWLAANGGAPNPSDVPEWTFPDCTGLPVSECEDDIAAVTPPGVSVTYIVTPLTIEEADLDLGGGAVVTTDPAHGATVQVLTEEVHLFPNPGELPMVLPEPATDDTYETYFQKLVDRGFTGSLDSLVLDPSLADTHRGSNAVVRVHPGGGTRVPKDGSVPVKVDLNPPGLGVPPGGGGSDCACDVHSLDFSPLALSDACLKFPWGIFCWIPEQFAAVFGASPLAPSVTIPSIDLGTAFGTDMVVPEVTFDAAVMDDSVGPFFSVIREALGWFLWVGGMVWLGSRLLGRDEVPDVRLEGLDFQ